MKLRYRLGIGLLVVLALAVSTLAWLLSHDSPCTEPPAVAAGEDTMQAVVYTCYGGPEVLQQATLAKPAPAANAVLVRVHAAAVNPLDWHYLRGEPYFMRLGSGLGAPKDIRLGVDFAGTVEAVGAGVTEFAPGDRVFGGSSGAFGEYVTVAADGPLAKMPAGLRFEQAAAVPVAGLTALQALRDQGHVQPGQKVLVNGASGGVGSFAVQIAKAAGAEVTGVCSTRNVELVRALGADHVIDYTRQSYADGAERYDLVVDLVGNHPVSANRGVLTDTGRYVIVGGPPGRWLGPLARPLAAAIQNLFVDQELGMMLAQLKKADLEFLAEAMANARLTPLIDRRYPLAGVADAIRYSESGRARGKIIIEVVEQK